MRFSSHIQEIYTRKYLQYNNQRLKTEYLINIVDMFLQRYVNFNKDNIKLNSRVLKYMYGNNYKQYINYLIDNEFIFLFKNYSVGRKAKCYKLTSKVKDQKITITNIPGNKKLDKKRNKLDIKYNNKIDVDIKQKLIDDLTKFDLLLDDSLDWIKENINEEKSITKNNLTCRKIAKKDIYYSFDTFGRFHTNYTTLKKEIRTNFIKFNGLNIKELDITNSQPFFLYLLMKNDITDFNEFDIDVLSGQIYDKISKLIGMKRKDVKVNIYSVIFGRHLETDTWNMLFKKLYPNVYEWIVQFKKKHKSYKSISRELQKIEATFMFKQLIPKIILYNKDIPIITIHDSIIIPEMYYDEVKIIFENELKRLTL